MNFFGHAAAACRQRQAPGFVLGAMLPDFASMVGAHLPPVEDMEIAGGITAHYRADAAFHAGATFLALLRDATRTLGSRGLRRGSARASAHVAIELLLDGTLCGDRVARLAYRRAMVAAAGGALGHALRGVPPAEAARWDRVWRRLATLDVPDAYADTGFVAARIAGILSRRPRLALEAGAERVMEDWLPVLQVQVMHHAPELLAAV